MELSRAKTIIHDRYIAPMNTALRQLCGPARHDAPVDVHIDWSAVEAWIAIGNDLESDLTEEQEIHVHLAEMSIQVLQLPIMWDALRKAVARYLCEDRSQVDCFNDNIDKLVVEFVGDENSPFTHLQLRKDPAHGIYHIVYVINVRVTHAQDAILSAVPLFEQLDAVLDEFISESSDEESCDEGLLDNMDIESEEVRKQQPQSMEVDNRQRRSGTAFRQSITELDAKNAAKVESAPSSINEQTDLSSEGEPDDIFEELEVDELDMSTLAKLEKKLGSTLHWHKLRRRGTSSSMDENDDGGNVVKRSKMAKMSSMLFRSRISRSSFSIDTASSTLTELDNVNNDTDDDDDDDDDNDNDSYTLSEETLRYDYEGDEFGVIEDDNLETGNAIVDLKRVARRQELARKRDLSKLFRLLQLSDNYWNPNDAESIVIEQCLQVLNRLKMMKSKERFVKAWVITKVNKRGLNQERYLVLTDRKFFTLKNDPERNTIDTKHVKFHDLSKFVMVDVGRFRQTSSDKKLQPYAMCIYTTNRREMSQSFTTNDNLSSLSFQRDLQDAMMSEDVATESQNDTAEAYDDEDIDDGDDDDDDAPPEYSETFSKEKKRGKLEKLASHGSKFIKKKIEKKLHGKKGHKKKKDDDWTVDGPIVESLKRPNTNDMTKHYFMANSQIHQSDFQKRFLEEVAWSLYCAAVARRGTFDNLSEPFIDVEITRPTSTGAKLYNKFKMGMSTGKQKHRNNGK